VRQWVLSLPFALRYRVAFDTALLGKVLRIFVRTVFAWLKRQARECGVPGGQCGAVTFIQRFGSALNLTPHFHILVLDGVYAASDGEHPRFYPLHALERRDVVAIATRVAACVAAVLQGEAGEPPEQKDPALAVMAGESILRRVAEGPHAGERVKTIGVSVETGDESFESGSPRCGQIGGFSVHAGVGIRAGRRKELERLCRYAARPPLAVERLSELRDGRWSYRLKRPWSNGTTHVIFEPLELLARLAVLVPAPRANLIHYHGVLAPAATWRASIVPKLMAAGAEEPECDCDTQSESRTRRRRNYPWAQVMARVFELDVLECPNCKGRLRILAAIHPPEATRKILGCLGLPTRAPPLKPAVFGGIFGSS
jgi:hypothetical protein